MPRERRTIGCYAALAAALAAASFGFWSVPAIAQRATAAIGVSAVVVPYTRIEVVGHTAVIRISEDDIRRGYTDVPGGTQIAARTNHRNGFSLSFHPRTAGLFTRATVTSRDGESEIGPDGGTLHQPYTGRETELRLSYRFFLVADVVPGDYPFPLQIAASPGY